MCLCVCREQECMICACVCVGLFDVFDENYDGQLDLAEMVRAVGWCCRSQPRKRHKCELINSLPLSLSLSPSLSLPLPLSLSPSLSSLINLPLSLYLDALDNLFLSLYL